MSADHETPSLAGIALTFAYISSTAFGGGQKAGVRQQVLARGWMDSESFINGLEVAELLPGPNVLNLAVYCGQKVRGIPGAIAAFLGASVPPFLIVLVAGALYFEFSSNPFVHAALRGFAAGALGLTLGNAIELTWDERTDWARLVLVVATALAVSFLRMPLLLVLVVFGGAGVIREYRRNRNARLGSESR
jgi:chromate transporter